MCMSHFVHSMNIGVYLGQLDLSLNHSGLCNLVMNKSHTVSCRSSLGVFINMSVHLPLLTLPDTTSVWECHQRGITALAASQTVSEIGNEWG